MPELTSLSGDKPDLAKPFVLRKSVTLVSAMKAADTSKLWSTQFSTFAVFKDSGKVTTSVCVLPRGCVLRFLRFVVRTACISNRSRLHFHGVSRQNALRLELCFKRSFKQFV